MRSLLEKLIRKENLTVEESRLALKKIQEGVDPVQLGAFLVLLRAKGETVEELLGFVRELRSQAKSLHLPFPVLDIVGTGGDGAGTVNISTGSALLAARCGIPVVKHGNRAVSSRCGSADVLEALGFSFENPEMGLERSNFAFCFAPDYHPLLQQIRQSRQALNIPTAFNLLGPLLNPAGTDHLMIGVFHPEFVRTIAEILFRLGTKRSLVYHGNGLDELSCLGPTDALLVTEKGIENLRIDPEKLGLKLCTRQDLQGGDAKENALLLAAGLNGASSLTDTLILNAGVGIYLYGKAATLEEGISMARGAAQRKSLKEALRMNPHAIVAEIKRASPSIGKIGVIADPAKRSCDYVAAGAAAISVLTHANFEGSLDDLRSVAKALQGTQVPILRKDFLKEPIHIAQSAAAGADAVLLIAGYLKERTEEMLEMTKRLGLEALVEVHSEEELAYIKTAEIIGVNQRNLRPFLDLLDASKTSGNQPEQTNLSMHPEVCEELIDKLPESAVKLAASGIASAEDAARAFALGYDAILVGEALTRAEDPQQLLIALRGTCL